MSRFNKALRVIIGIAVFYIVYWFLTRNQIVAEFVRPSVDSGKVGAATANVVTSVIEILAAIGGVVLAILTRLLAYVADSIEPLITQANGETTPNVNSSPNTDPRKLTDDLSKLLIQAVLEGNRELTIQLAHRLSKKKFLGGKQEGP